MALFGKSMDVAGDPWIVTKGGGEAKNGRRSMKKGNENCLVLVPWIFDVSKMETTAGRVHRRAFISDSTSSGPPSAYIGSVVITTGMIIISLALQ